MYNNLIYPIVFQPDNISIYVLTCLSSTNPTIIKLKNGDGDYFNHDIKKNSVHDISDILSFHIHDIRQKEKIEFIAYWSDKIGHRKLQKL